jgi:hypothetical protein
MRGGMIMIGDMFNNQLKGRVDSLCSEISNLLGSQPGLLHTGSFQSQTQSSGPNSVDLYGLHGQSDLFVPDPRSNWYPQELGAPSAIGAQNNVRYAYFANAHRLAVDSGGDVWVYDTLNHQIGGFSQQQGGASSLTFNSQYGPVNVASLPVVYRHGQLVPPSAPNVPSNPSNGLGGANPLPPADIYQAIEQLGSLRDKGILTDDEFSSKKAELLSRI